MQPTDEQAADQAERAGGRFKVKDYSKLWAVEPARWKVRDGGEHWIYSAGWWWAEASGLLFACPYPTCERCGFDLTWHGPPERSGGIFRYAVSCVCGDDVIESPFPLQMGGTAAWWSERWAVICGAS